MATNAQADIVKSLLHVLEDYVRPLIHGFSVFGPFHGDDWPRDPVVYDTCNRLKVFLAPNSRSYYLLKRAVPFSNEEKSFMEDIFAEYSEYGPGRPDFVEMAPALVERAIARNVSPECADTLYRVIETYASWSAQADSGSGLSHTTGICVNRKSGSSSSFFSLRSEDYLKKIASTPDTILAIGCDGSILGLESISAKINNYKKNQDILAPIGFADLAMWTHSSQRIAVRLTREGDILIFKKKKLLFARKNGVWRCLPHSLVLGELAPQNIPEEQKATRQAAYLTSMDMAFLRQRSSLFFVPFLDKKERICAAADCMLDAFEGPDDPQLLRSIVNSRKFFEIPRKVRVELCLLDGAVVMDPNGNILGVGLNLKGVRDQGGETAVGGKMPLLPKDSFGVVISGEGEINFYRGQKAVVSLGTVSRSSLSG